MLADFPRLAGLIPYNDETMLGTLDALRRTGRLGEVSTVSRNGTAKAVQAVLDGWHAGTWDTEVTAVGQQIGELVVRAAVRREDLDGLRVAGPIGRMITPEAAARWTPWDRRIPYHPFRYGLD